MLTLKADRVKTGKNSPVVVGCATTGKGAVLPTNVLPISVLPINVLPINDNVISHTPS